MRQQIGWTSRDEDGVKWDVQAHRNRNIWVFTRRAHRTEDWQPIDPPGVEDWENLLDVMQRKYQRRRCAWRDVEQVEHELEQAKLNQPNL